MAPDRLDLAERMSRAARDLGDESDPVETMRVAVRLAATNVRGCHAAAISLIRRQGQIETPAYTDERALSGDLLQYELGEGPCLQAAWEDRVVYSPDLGADPRWSAWGPRVAERHGLHSVLCVQLFTASDSLGALNLYSEHRHGFDADGRDDGVALAAHVAVAMAAVRRTDDLSRALDTRSLIGQAIGIVRERYRLDPAAAFRVLARVSSESDLKIRDVAQELVMTGELHGVGHPGAADSTGPAPEPSA